MEEMDGKSLLIAALGLTGAAAGTAALGYGQHKQTSSMSELEIRIAAVIMEVSAQNQRISLLEKSIGGAQPASNVVQSATENSKLRSRIAQLEARVKNLEDEIDAIAANSQEGYEQEYQEEPPKPRVPTRAQRNPRVAQVHQPTTQAGPHQARQTARQQSTVPHQARQTARQQSTVPHQARQTARQQSTVSHQAESSQTTRRSQQPPQEEPQEEIQDEDTGSDSENVYSDDFIFNNSIRQN